MSVDIDDAMPEEWTSQVSPPAISDQLPLQDQSAVTKNRRPYRLRKLRESCNNCALSKVKCTKEQPICSRCEERDMECQYSPSRRIGKRRGPSSQQRTADIVQMTVPPKELFNCKDFGSPIVIDPELNFDDTDSGELLSSFSRGRHVHLGDKCNATMSGHCSAMLPRIHNPVSAKSLDPFMFSDASANSTSWGFDFEYEDPMLLGNSSTFPYDEDLLSPHIPTGTYTHVPGYGLSRQTRDSEKFVATNTDDYFGGSPEAGAKQRTENCMERAMAILKTLKGPPSRCTSVMPSPLPTPSSLTPTTFPFNRSSQGLNISSAYSSSSSGSSSHATHHINEVLAVNKEAITAACEIIDCACSVDIQVAFVLTSIASQVMSRYVSAASTRYDDLMAAADGSCGENPTKMHAQLVLGELHLVLRLIESLATRFKIIQKGEDKVSQEMGVEAGVSSYLSTNTVFENESEDDERQRRYSEQKVHQGPDSTAMFAELEKFLRDQLRSIVKEATTTLRTR